MLVEDTKQRRDRSLCLWVSVVCACGRLCQLADRTRVDLHRRPALPYTARESGRQEHTEAPDLGTTIRVLL